MDKRLGDRHPARTAGAAPRRYSVSRANSPFVGRDEEMRRLTAALTFAAEGQGSIIFLTGQPGVGKTRLAREALAVAKERGFTILEGRAFPLDAGLAYDAILDAFGPLLRNLDSDRLAALVSGLPDLGRLFGGLQLPEPEPLGDPALEKTRFFETMSRLLERLAREAPVALLIDDIQGTDPASLELLLYLARGLSDQRTLLLATYSSDALDTSSSMRAMVTSLQREGLAEEISLSCLAPDAVDKLARSILGGEAPASLLALLDSRARGIPLFIEALVLALVDCGGLVRGPSERDGWDLNPGRTWALPQTVRHLILNRLERLATSERSIIDLIAITGDGISHNILRAASVLDEETIIEGLKRLRAAGLVVEEAKRADTTYSITHPLIQEVIYAELPQAARRRAHMAAIRALESVSKGRPEDTNHLARHYLGAGRDADPGRALTAIVAAGERALSLYANEEAARHFSAALTILREVQGWSTSTPTPDMLPGLLEQLGEAWDRIGDREAAIRAWNEALAERQQSGDIVAASRLHNRLALAELDLGHLDVCNSHLDAGMVALAGRELSQELADLHFARFLTLTRVDEVAAMAETSTQLINLAKQLRTPRAEAEANFAAARVARSEDDVIGARECALHALRIGEQAQELVLCWLTHCLLVTIDVRMGEHRRIRYHANCGSALAQRLGTPTLQIRPRVELAFANFMSGDWEESLRCAMDAVMLARRVGHPRELAYSLAGRAMIEALQGHIDAAAACVFEVRVAYSNGNVADSYVFGLTHIAEICIAMDRGQVQQALDIAMGFLLSSKSMVAPASPALPCTPIGLMLLAEAQVKAGDPESALETAAKLIGMGPKGAPYLTALASRAQGLAWQALGRRDTAMNCLAQAYHTFAALEMPFESARASLEHATLAAASQPELAMSAAQQSLVIFERLGDQRYAGRARLLLRGLGVLPPRSCRPRLSGVSVSERELDIARLVAQGLTTAEIAKSLTISPLTVSSHLHRVYTRLGISSRAALARLVLEAGLLLP